MGPFWPRYPRFAVLISSVVPNQPFNLPVLVQTQFSPRSSGFSLLPFGFPFFGNPFSSICLQTLFISPAGSKGNPSLLDIFSFFPRGLNQLEETQSAILWLFFGLLVVVFFATLFGHVWETQELGGSQRFRDFMAAYPALDSAELSARGSERTTCFVSFFSVFLPFFCW